MYFFLLNPCFQHNPRVSANTIMLIFPGGYQLEIYPVVRDNDPPLLQISRQTSPSPSVHVPTEPTQFLLKTTATSPLIYSEQTWILLAWKAWRGEHSMSGKSATCWWYSVTSVSLKSAHRMQLLLSHLTIYGAWAKTSWKWIHHRFIPKWAIPVSSQKPRDSRNSQRLSLASGEMCFFPIICQDLKMVHHLKIQLEPSLPLDHGVTATLPTFVVCDRAVTLLSHMKL